MKCSVIGAAIKSELAEKLDTGGFNSLLNLLSKLKTLPHLWKLNTMRVGQFILKIIR